MDQTNKILNNKFIETKNYNRLIKIYFYARMVQASKTLAFKYHI